MSCNNLTRLNYKHAISRFALLHNDSPILICLLQPNDKVSAICCVLSGSGCHAVPVETSDSIIVTAKVKANVVAVHD